MRRRTVALAVFALALGGGGCGERAEPLGELRSAYPVTVEGAGDEALVVDAAPRRIVALEPGPAELVARLAPARLVGIPAAAELRGAPARRTVVAGPGGAVNVRAVAGLRPDLLLAAPNTDPVDLARASRRSGAPVYVQPTNSVADVVRAALELGFVLGEPARARRLAGSIRRGVEDVEARTAGVARVRVFVDTGSLVTIPRASLLGDLVRRGGGMTLRVGGADGERIGACDVARLQPDVLLVVAPRGAPPPRARSYACRGRPPARIAAVPESVVTVAGPRVPRALALVARALHPDAFGS